MRVARATAWPGPRAVTKSIQAVIKLLDKQIKTLMRTLETGSSSTLRKSSSCSKVSRALERHQGRIDGCAARVGTTQPTRDRQTGRWHLEPRQQQDARQALSVGAGPIKVRAVHSSLSAVRPRPSKRSTNGCVQQANRRLRWWLACAKFSRFSTPCDQIRTLRGNNVVHRPHCMKKALDFEHSCCGLHPAEGRSGQQGGAGGTGQTLSRRVPTRNGRASFAPREPMTVASATRTTPPGPCALGAAERAGIPFDEVLAR